VSQFPDPYPPGPGQEGTQPPPGQAYSQPPGQAYSQPPGDAYGQSSGPGYGQPAGDAYGQQRGQAYGQSPGQGFTPAPPVPAGYGYGQYQNVVPQGMYFDQLSGLNLPEGTQLASVGRRIGAWFLAIPLFIVTLGIGYIVWGLVVWGRGQTPALQVLGMRVWRPETNKVAGFWFMALREIVGRVIDGILSLITEITSFVLFVAGKKHQSLHDVIAGTVVLRDPDNVLAS
jgi:uncharacterized RDD family membrane protein YckC